MNVTVSAAEANRKFSELLRGVSEGKSYTVTNHGRPVAKITSVEPVEIESEKANREAAFKRFLDEMSARPAQNLPKFTRDEMNERG